MKNVKINSRDKYYSTLCRRKFIWLLHKTPHYLSKIILGTLGVSLVVVDSEELLREKYKYLSYHHFASIHSCFH